MNTYKLCNIIKRDLVHGKRNYKNIKKQKFSFTFIRDLCNKYYVTEWCEFEHCCYGEDRNCWIEVHSSWMKHGRKMTDAEFNNEVYKSIKGIINSHFTKEQIGRRSIFVAEHKDCIYVIIPMRDTSSKSDHYLIFDKKHPINDVKELQL